MSIPRQISELAESVSQRQARGEFFKLGLMLMKHRGAYNAHANAEGGTLHAACSKHSAKDRGHRWDVKRLGRG
jgi:hypothetical protein